jgi:hypothetical protein
VCSACGLLQLERDDERFRLEGQQLVELYQREFFGDRQDQQAELQQATGCKQSA